MTLFKQGPFDEAEARAFFDRFVASGPARLAWLAAELAPVGIDLAPNLAVLDRVVAFAAANLSNPEPVEAPLWWSDRVAAEGWTHYGACAVDGIIHLTAEIYRVEVGAHWVYHHDDPRDADHQRPVMSVPGLAPPWRAAGTMVDIGRGRQPPQRWGEGVRFGLETARRVQGALAPVADPGELEVEVEVSPSRVPGTTWQLWIDEGAEMAMGRPAFDSLVARFAALPGVEKVEQEDREIFLVTAPGVSGTDLETRCRAIVAELVAGNGR